MTRILYIGRSGSGKTTLMLKNLRDWFDLYPKKKRWLILISPTAPYQDGYQSIKKKINQYYSTINSSITEELLYLATENQNLKKDKQKNITIIIDDLGESSFMKHAQKDNLLNDLVVMSRHVHTNLIFLFQRMKQATNSLRDNADIIYLFRTDDIDQKESFRKSFCSDLDSQQFSKMLKISWDKPYGYLRIDRQDPSKNNYTANSSQTFHQEGKML
jgi:hypothetical protein